MRISRSCVTLIMVVGTLLPVGSRVDAQERAPEEPALTQMAGEFPDNFTLEVEVELPVAPLLPGQGSTTRSMRVTVGNDIIASVWKASQVPAPKYYPLRTPGYQAIDYDAEGNLIVSMWSEGAAVCDAALHEEYSESHGYRVGPEDAVKGQVSGSFLRRYPPSYSNTEAMSMLRTIRRALGRPPAGDFTDLEEAKAKTDGAVGLRVVGQSSPYSGSGVWHLVTDPTKGHLVRSGRFGPRGGTPRIEFQTQGSRQFGDFIIAWRGEYREGPQHIDVRVISLSPKVDTELIEEARGVIARVQSREVEVFDHRADPSQPTVYLVQPGDLDEK